MSRVPALWILESAAVTSDTQLIFVVVVQSLNCVRLHDPMDTARQAPLTFPMSQSLLKFMSIESVMLSNHLILCYSL